MSFLPHQRIADAVDATESEIDIIDSEQTAYRRFRRRLDEIDAANGRSATPAGVPEMQTTTAEPVSVAESLRATREAYRETVMATQHYDAEYGESLREHVATEFGNAVAAQVVDGHTLTPFLKKTLYSGATKAIQQRAELRKSLVSERRSLRHCRGAVSDVQERLNVIHACLDESPDTVERCEIDTQLASLESECQTLLTRRQRRIENRSGILLLDDRTGFAEYLYADLDSCFPVLTAVLECIETVRTCRIRSLQ